jgi:phage terminase large subunit
MATGQAAHLRALHHPRMWRGGQRPVIDEIVYRPHGHARDIFRLKGLEQDEIILSGPIRTGKTRAVLELANLLCERYPGSRHLFVRRTRVSLTQSVLVTWEEAVRPHCDIARMQRSVRDEYRFPNGTVVVVGGMDSDDKVLSAEYDMIYTFETRELKLAMHEILTGRLTHGKMPYQKLVGDTNPDRPNHYLKQREKAGNIALLPTLLEDNPRWFDGKTRQWTLEGQALIKKLQRYTGVRYLRLVKGLWSSAEGMVYEEWKPERHIVSWADLGFGPRNIPENWRLIRSVDFGFTNAFVAQWWLIDPDGRMYLALEWVKTRMLVEDHAKKMLALERAYGWQGRIEATVCDHDAEDRATLERHLSCSTVAADKRIETGIQEVQGRLRVQEDGLARLYVLEGCLIEPDQAMTEPDEGEPLPCGLVEEVESYAYDPNRPEKEVPVAKSNHSCDATRYASMFVEHGGVVWVPVGLGGMER